MIEVLLVDDEPAVGRYLRSLIDVKCEGFKVVATAENGRQALAVLNSRPIDLVVTDIRMPVIDGLELSRRIKEIYNDLPVIIVSGYQDFEYARSALVTGVVDYLLKPVNLSKLQEVLGKLTPAILSQKSQKVGAQLLQALEDPKAFIDAETRLYVALYRRDGLPLRFGVRKAELEFKVLGKCFLIPLRDGKDTLLCCYERQLSYAAFKQTVQEYTGKEHAQTDVLIVLSKSILIGELSTEVYRLFVSVDQLITPGRRLRTTGTKSQLAHVSSLFEVTRLLDCALQLGKPDLLSEAFSVAADRWKSEQLGLLAIEQELRGYLQYVTSKQELCLLPQGFEYELDTIMSDVPGYEELLSSLNTRLVPLLLGPGEVCASSTVPVLYEELVSWIEQNYEKNLTLSSLAERFRISPSYVSKLIRKYSESSFTELLTEKRIEAAKLLLVKAPELPLKDIARRVGYQDQFYFSRVFKSVVGVPPSEYGSGSADR